MKQITLAAFLISSCLYAETSAFSPPSFQQIFEHVTQLPKAVQGIAFLITAKSRALLNLEESTLLKTTSVDLKEEQNVLPNKRVQEFNQERYEQLQQSFEEDQLSFAELEEYLLLLREYEQLQNTPELEHSSMRDSTSPPPTHQTTSAPGMKMAGNCNSIDNNIKTPVKDITSNKNQNPVLGIPLDNTSAASDDCHCIQCIRNHNNQTALALPSSRSSSSYFNNIAKKLFMRNLKRYLGTHVILSQLWVQDRDGNTMLHKLVCLKWKKAALTIIKLMPPEYFLLKDNEGYTAFHLASIKDEMTEVADAIFNRLPKER